MTYRKRGDLVEAGWRAAPQGTRVRTDGVRVAQHLIDGPREAAEVAPPKGARPPTESGTATRPVPFRALVTAATGLAAVLALFHLGHKSLWLDEGYSMGHAHLGWDQFWQVLAHREPNGGLHSLILFPLVRVSDSEWWVRLPSALAAVATVPVLAVLLRRLFGPAVAVLGAFLLAANGFSLGFAQEARAYALAMLLATTSTWCYVAFLQDRRRSQWWAWVAVSALLPYAHLFGSLIIASQATSALLRRDPSPRPTRRLLAGFVVIGLVGGLVLLLVATGEDVGQAAGIPGVSVVRFVGVYARLVGNAGVPLLGVAAVLWGYTTVVIGRELRASRPFRPTERQWGFCHLAIWVTLPVVVIAALTPVQPLFGARYFLILIPAASGLTALGVMTIPAGGWRRAAGLTVAVLTIAGAVGWYRQPPVDDVRAAAAAMAEDARPGDGAVFLPWFMKVPFDPYAMGLPAVADRVEATWPAAPWGRFLPDHPDHPGRDDIDATVAAHDRVWVVVRDERTPDDDRDLAAFRRALARDHRSTRHLDLDGVDLWLYERR